MKHFNEVCEPYEFEKENASTGAVEVVRKLTDCINEERSLIKFVKIFVSNNKECVDDVDEDEDCYDDSSEEENVCDNLNQEL